MVRFHHLCKVAATVSLLSACGTYVPSKDLTREDSRETDTSKDDYGQSSEGRAEANIVGNIRCEIQNGIYQASTIRNDKKLNVPYLNTSWGTQVTLKLTWDETSALSPGLSFINPLSNMQSMSVGVGGSATAHATRVETVTFLFANADLFKDEAGWLNSSNNPSKTLHDCSVRESGMMIRSDLKIGDFIVDKATLASTGIVTTEDAVNSPFSTFQEELTFVGAYSGNITPTWKLTRFTSNATSNLLSATRTVTGDVLITLGALAQDDQHPGMFLHKLADPAASQHTAAIIGGATASQLSSQGH